MATGRNRAYALFDCLAALGFLAAARRTGRGVSARYLALGACVGAGYRLVHDRYVGRFRRRPVRYLALNALVIVASAAAYRNVDADDQYAHGFGYGVASALLRLVGPSADDRG